jgi:hypothetical protein
VVFDDSVEYDDEVRWDGTCGVMTERSKIIEWSVILE